MTAKTLTVLKITAALLAAGASRLALAGWEEPFLQTISGTDALRIAQEPLDAVHVTLWAVKAVSIVASTFLLFFTAKRLHSDDYQSALLSFIGAVIAGSSPFIAEALFFT